MPHTPAPSPTPVPSPAPPLLRVNNIEVVFNRIVLALRGVSLEAPEGSIVALLGANGAGKSVTLKAISGLLPAERGQVIRGSIEFQGRPIRDLDPVAIVRSGLAQVMEGRRCFEHLTVEENLLCGAYTRVDGHAALRRSLEMTYEHFPRLRVKRRMQSGYLSGGEQQMVALGRALMAKPKLILLDEPSMGLAPNLIAEIFEIIASLHREEKMTFLLAEQNTSIAMRYSSFGYVMETGRVVMEGTVAELQENEDVREFYLGVGEQGRRSFRDVKRYRRRKRWLAG